MFMLTPFLTKLLQVEWMPFRVAFTPNERESKNGERYNGSWQSMQLHAHVFKFGSTDDQKRYGAY